MYLWEKKEEVGEKCKSCDLYREDKHCISIGLCKTFDYKFFKPKEEKIMNRETK